MVVVAQLVRASVCGTEGRGFEPHLLPKLQSPLLNEWAFLYIFIKEIQIRKLPSSNKKYFYYKI